MSDNTKIWCISLAVADPDVAAFEGALEPLVESLMWTVDEPRGVQRMEGFVTRPPDPDQVMGVLQAVADRLNTTLAQVQICELEPRDWVAENLKDFPPLDVGRFYIYASHVAWRPLAGRIPLRIDPGVAFGTGTHATTSGCLRAIEDLGHRRRFKRALDVGTGSGILAIAMARLWKRKVIGSDIDPIAVRVAGENAALNAVAKLVDFRPGAGLARVAQGARFDLIVANILARPLTAMAGDLSRRLTPGGYVVLSGLIERDERFVIAPYVNHGLKFERRYVRDGWLTLVLKKRA